MGEGSTVPLAARERLRRTRGFVFDMDGTLVLGDRRNHGLRPLPGALEITGWLRGQGIPFVLLTNGTTQPPQAYAQKLRDVGFDLPDDGVLTPASSAVAVLRERGHRRVMVLGVEGLTGPLREAGFDVLPPEAGGGVDAVLVGWYRDFTMDTLEAACHAVWNGAALYSASQSLFFATAEGRTLGTSRAICAMITDLTGCEVRVVGKPSLDALRAAGRRLKAEPHEIAVVGDDPELEVPMAHRGGALAVAVNTGLGDSDSFAHLPPDRRPHLTVHGVDELLRMCQQAGLCGSPP